MGACQPSHRQELPHFVVMGSEAGLVTAGWGWVTSANPSDSYGGGSTKHNVSITYFSEWTEWKCPRSDCFHTLRVPTDPFKSLWIIKAQKMYFTQYGPFKCLCPYYFWYWCELGLTVDLCESDDRSEWLSFCPPADAFVHVTLVAEQT